MNEQELTKLIADGFAFGFGLTSLVSLAGLCSKKIFYMIVDIIKG